VRLRGGDMVAVETPRAGAVTLAVRPEHVRVGPAGLPATITNLVYFGTDTHAHCALSDGTPVVARVPARADGVSDLVTGDRVHLTFAPGAVQVLAA
jgi:spermidine/putrescine transport system ATP-binding protein